MVDRLLSKKQVLEITGRSYPCLWECNRLATTLCGALGLGVRTLGRSRWLGQLGK